MNTTGKKNLSSGKLILLICVILTVAVAIFALLNSRLAKEKTQLSVVGEISVLKGGQEAARITPKILQEIRSETFTASQKSGGKAAVDRTFTGVPLADLLDSVKATPTDGDRLTLGSVDGYSVVISAAEALDRDNVWLVWAADGEPLPSDSAPYMVIIRKDPFSQRWSKMLCEIKIDPA